MIASENDIENIKISCTILSKTYGFLSKEIKEGISLLQLDKIAEGIIITRTSMILPQKAEL